MVYASRIDDTFISLVFFLLFKNPKLIDWTSGANRK